MIPPYEKMTKQDTADFVVDRYSLLRIYECSKEFLCRGGYARNQKHTMVLPSLGWQISLCHLLSNRKAEYKKGKVLLIYASGWYVEAK